MGQLIDTIIDQQAIEKQLTFLNSQLTASAANLSSCAVAAKNFSDQFANSKSIKELIETMNSYQKTVNDSQKAQNDLANLEKTRATTLLQLQKAQTETAKAEQLSANATLINQKAQTEAAKAEQIRSKSALDAQKAIDSKAKSEKAAEKVAQQSAAAEKLMSESEQTLINTLKKSGIEVEKLNLSKSEATKIATLTKTVNTAEEGSFQKLSAQYNTNLMAYNKLSDAQRDSSAGKAMQASLSGMSNKLKEISGSVGNFQMDVGNYKNSILNAIGVNNGFLGNLSSMALGAEKTGVAFKDAAANGVKTLSTSLKELMMNPIVATIAAIAAVFMLFKAAIEENGESTEKLGQVMAPLKEILAFVMNLVGKFISVLLDGVKALENMGNAIMELIPGLDKIAERNAKAIELEKEKQEIEERGRKEAVLSAKDEMQFNELRVKSRQKDVYSLKQRLEFVEQADQIEKESMKRKLSLATDTYNNLKATYENEGKSYKDLSLAKRKELDDAEAEMYQVQSEYWKKMVRLSQQKAALISENQSEMIEREKTHAEAEIAIWEGAHNTENMNAAQQASYERELKEKEINLQIKINNEKMKNDLDAAKKRIEDNKKAIEEERNEKTMIGFINIQAYNKLKAEQDKEYDEEMTSAREHHNEALFESIAYEKAKQDGIMEEAIKGWEKYNEGWNKYENQQSGKGKEELDVIKKQNDDQKAILEKGNKEAAKAEAKAKQRQDEEVLQKQNEANLALIKAQANYESLNFEAQRKFDKTYFELEQKDAQDEFDLRKKNHDLEAGEEKSFNLKKKTDLINFQNQQLALLTKHKEDMLSENGSLQVAQIKLDEDYANHDVAYQQDIAKKIFDINYTTQSAILSIKLANKQIDKEAYDAAMKTLNAEKEVLEQSQKEGLEKNVSDQLKTKLDNETELKKSAAAKDFLNGIINEDQYETQIQDIEKQSQDQQLKNKIAFVNAKLLKDDLAVKGQKMGNEELTKLIAEGNKARADLDANAAKNKEDDQDKWKQKVLTGLDLAKSSAEELKNIGDAIFERQMEQLRAKQAEDDKATEHEKENIQARAKSGMLTAKEADAQEAALALQKSNRDKQFAKENLKLRQQQAKFERDEAIFSIVINTAKAIVADLTKSPLKIAFDAAIGASELAVVLSKPIPQYAKGTSDHAGGLAIVGDAFRSELAITPEGDFYKTPSVPSIVSLPKHTKVLPDYDKVIQNLAFNASIKAMNNSIPTINAFNDNRIREKMDDLISQMTRQYNTLNQLDNLKTLNKMDSKLSILNNIDKSLRSMKKSEWGS